jgi:hypothetical protein
MRSVLPRFRYSEIARPSKPVIPTGEPRPLRLVVEGSRRDPYSIAKPNNDYKTVIPLALSECEGLAQSEREGSGVTRHFSSAPPPSPTGEHSRMDPSSISAPWQRSTTHPISRRTSAHVPHSS